VATNNAINLKLAGIVAYDAAGSFTAVAVTQHAVAVGGATSQALTSLAVGSNGQVLVGSSGADPIFATLTGTGGITFTTGAGTLAINNTGGGLTWTSVAVDASFTVNSGTIANKAGLLTMTLPASAALGDIIAITGINTALGWKIAQNANQQIFMGTSSTTIGITGSLASINIRDTVYMVCVVAGASTVWNVVNSMGNITVA